MNFIRCFSDIAERIAAMGNVVDKVQPAAPQPVFLKRPG
jgi:hypothetical protein